MRRIRAPGSGRGSSGSGRGEGRGTHNTSPSSPPREEHEVEEEVAAGSTTQPEVPQLRAPEGPERRLDGHHVISLDGNNK